MSLNSITKSFFKEKRHRKCPDCNIILTKNIFLDCHTSFDEYETLINWEYKNSIFELSNDVLNKSAGGHGILISNPTINNLSDINDQCVYLNKLGYQIRRASLQYYCEDCSFMHILYANWAKPQLKLLFDSELVKISDYTIRNNYIKNTGTICAPDLNHHSKMYNFDYTLNVKFSQYKKLQHKIKQILLLG